MCSFVVSVIILWMRPRTISRRAAVASTNYCESPLLLMLSDVQLMLLFRADTCALMLWKTGCVRILHNAKLPIYEHSYPM